MTVIPAENNTGSDAHRDEFRKQWGIPFARPGGARDYAQCILSTVSVRPSFLAGVLVQSTDTRQNQYMTGADIVIDGGWLLETGALRTIVTRRAGANGCSVLIRWNLRGWCRAFLFCMHITFRA